MNRREFVQKIKNEPILTIGSINYGRVMAIELYLTSLLYYIKSMVESLLFSYKLVYSNNNAKVLLAYMALPNARKDHFLIFKHFKSILENKIEYDYIGFKRKFAPFLFLKKLLKYNFLLNNIKRLDITFYDKSRIGLALLKYIYAYEELNAIEFDRYTIGVTFCDAYKADNLVAQILNSYNIVTYTLQHGQYRRIKNDLSAPENEVIYNFISDYLLAWGEATKKEFTECGIDESRIICAGSLLGDIYRSNDYHYKPIKSGKFGVLLSADINKKSNTSMLKLANCIKKITGMDYIIRYHPRNKRSLYKKIIDSNIQVSNGALDEFYDNVEFLLLYMTGVFIDILQKRKLCFIYNDEYLEDAFKVEQLMIKDEKTLLDKYRMYINNPEHYNDVAKNLYKYYNNTQNIANNYLSAINNMKNNRRTYEE
ncbi:MAG: hypothetical protein K8S14_03745 [Actinomycetia bacterium]|nr:hypothetical protein [Actinomycetes bacterium]